MSGDRLGRAGVRVHGVDHGKAHLKADELAAGLDSREKKADNQAQNQTRHEFSSENDGQIKGMRREFLSDQGQSGPKSQSQNQAQGRLDRRRQGLTAEKGHQK